MPRSEDFRFAVQPKAWKPHAGQKRAVKFLLEHAAAGLFADPGVGKTSTVFAAFTWLKKRGLAEKMLVVAPLRPAHLVWPAEAEKWLDFRHLKVVVLHGPRKDALLAEDANVFVINPDGLDWLLQAQRVKRQTPSGQTKTDVLFDLKRFKGLGFDTLVLDELTLWKHSQSGRHRAMKQLVGTFARRWGLTGTPAPNGLIDLFGQVYMLDMGRTFGPYVTHFRQRYFLQSFSDPNVWHLKKDAAEEIYRRLDPLVLRLAAEDFIDMPSQVDNLIRFDLPPEAQRVYDELEEEMITVIDGETVTAASAAVVSMKCRQVVNGGLYKEVLPAKLGGALQKLVKKSGPREWVAIHDAKTDLLAELIEELQGNPVLVAYDFQHDLDRLRKRFGKDVPVIGGGTSTKRAQELEREWNRGNLPFLLGHPQSMGHGLNLQGAGNHVCWYGLTWNLELYDQFNRRVRRQGSKHQTVFVHHLVARGTIDETIYYALRSKARTQNALLEALKELRSKRRK